MAHQFSLWFQQCFRRKRPRAALAPGPRLHSNPLSKCKIWNLSWVSYPHSTMVLPDSPWIIPPRWRTQATAWSTCICRPPSTYLLLGFYFDYDHVTWEDMGHFIALAEEKSENAKPLFNIQTPAAEPSSRTCHGEAISKTSGTKPSTLCNLLSLWRRTWTRPFWIRTPQVQAAGL